MSPNHCCRRSDISAYKIMFLNSGDDDWIKAAVYQSRQISPKA